jgi:hypothetical protein
MQVRPFVPRSCHAFGNAHLLRVVALEHVNAGIALLQLAPQHINLAGPLLSQQAQLQVPRTHTRTGEGVIGA